MDHDKFEQDVFKRPMIADDSSFAERIIAIARTRAPELKWHTRLRLVVDEILISFPFPKPAYALASIAIMGFMLGMVSQPAEAITLDAFLYEASEII